MKFVLDTTAFSALMRRDEAMLEFLKGHRPGDIATVPPVMAEIEYGIRRLDNASRKYLLPNSERDRLTALIGVLPWITESSVNFGIIKADAGYGYSNYIRYRRFNKMLTIVPHRVFSAKP